MKLKSIAASLVAAAGVLSSLSACSGGAPQVPAADTVEVAPKDIASRVAVSASIDSREVIALSTALTSTVTDIAVHVGQPVQDGQIVARLDVSQLQRQLDAQQAQQLSADAAALNELERAQQQLGQQQDALNRGLNARLTQAETAQREAQLRYDDALATFEERKHQVDAGLDPAVMQQANAVDAARRNVNLVGLESVRANAVNHIAALLGQQDPLTPVIGILEADERYGGARSELDAAQRGYESALQAVDADLAAKQRAVGQAFQAKSDADVALEVTRLAVQQELATSASSVEQARRGREASQLAAEVGQNQLRVDIQSGEVRSPIDGVVTEVVAQRGGAAAGHLLTVADPNRLILTAKVNEVDAGKVQVGNEVTFTTPSTGVKQYRGRIAEISSVAAPQGGPEAPAGGQPPRPEFPVLIEVEGDTEGLRIGGTAKVQITTATAKEALTVPREAIIDAGGTYSVLVLSPVADKPGEFEVAEAPVTLGIVTDLEAEVHGIKEGVRVVKSPAAYRERIGQRVRVDEAVETGQTSSSESPEPTATAGGAQ
ncbi:HlyD family efflux transporter periplasmic adaptor subunit [Corynebacterium sp. TA-R-1]|uniref:HlyD family efflux transporter periplasmic adaptor subunit n=1 Tax=Corynebacterium stercoris TaxID=2943490 RepID=A0ABT1G1G0_9CORY|nr:HlyD family efflux transporter periplasmic adaptor subunit [Corynebacterium stercoris]